MFKQVVLGALTLAAVTVAPPAFASFHLFQIEQVIAGVDGDTSRQAIQLRMRFAEQNFFLDIMRIVAWDAAGQNPIIVFDFTAPIVPNGAAGARILIATPNFLPGLTPDAVITNPIPASYLAAGKLTWEDDGGKIWWGLAWGGASYTGTNIAISSMFGGNDADGNFNPPFPGPLPTASKQAVRFNGPAAALSTTNAADYALTAGPASFTNNAGATGTVPVELLEFRVE